MGGSLLLGVVPLKAFPFGNCSNETLMLGPDSTLLGMMECVYFFSGLNVGIIEE